MLISLIRNGVVLVMLLNACAATLNCEQAQLRVFRKNENPISVSIYGAIERIRYSKKDFPNGLSCEMLHGNREMLKQVRFSVGDYKRNLSGFNFEISDTSLAVIDSVKLVDDDMAALIWLDVKKGGVATLKAFSKEHEFSGDLSMEWPNVTP